MAAGLGFKTFLSGDVLSAGDVNGYLMQGVLVFASAAARDAAITSPQEGQYAYLKDTNVTYYYSGSAWVSASASSPLTTKGDVYTFSTVDARLGVGANNTVLTADSAQATGLKWATPTAAAPNGYTLLNSGGTTLSGSSTVTISGISNVTSLIIMTFDASSSASQTISVRINGDSTAKYNTAGLEFTASTAAQWWGESTSELTCANLSNNSASVAYIAVTIDSAASTAFKRVSVNGMASAGGGSGQKGYVHQGRYEGTAVVTSVSLVSTANFDAGKVYVYGASV